MFNLIRILIHTKMTGLIGPLNLPILFTSFQVFAVITEQNSLDSLMVYIAAFSGFPFDSLELSYTP